MFYVILLWKWHEKDFNKKIMYFLVGILLALMGITLFTQPVFFQALFFNTFYLAIPFFFYMIYVVLKSIRKNNQVAKANLVGLALIFLAFFNDFAVGQNWYQSVPLMFPAVAVYVLIHVILMSKNFADSVRKTEQQNKELLALNASNEELAIELQEEMKRKDDFLANTSHELRNPLHAIINIAEAILRSRSNLLDDKTQGDVELQLTIGRHMSRTLEDLLDITRLKEHRIQLKKQRLDIKALVTGVRDMLKYLTENKDITVDIQIPDAFPELAADKSRVIQILFNLIHNAMKYTVEGRITVDAEIHGEMAKIHVADTGIGMDEKTLAVIFEPYRQDDSSITAIGGGVGLGLSICKQLIEMHGGTISVISSPGEGSTFTFTLPLAGETFQETAATVASAEETSEMVMKESPVGMTHAMTEVFTRKSSTAEKPRILAVDDDPVNLQVLKNILFEEQYELETVVNGKEALIRLESDEWDLVISDVMMPGMSGYDLTRAIREKYSIADLPVLLLTARSQPEDVYTGFLVGANDYVTKPVDAVELNVRVHALTDLQASIKERLNMEAAWLQAQIRPHFLLNTLNAIVSLSEMDTERMTLLLEKFTDYLQRSFYLRNLDKEVPLQYELDLLDSYFYIEQERFGSRLQVKWEMDETENIMIPPLALQTLAENAVNHGVLHQLEGGTVTIRVENKHDHVKISVLDDGVGMDDEKLEALFTFSSDQKRGIGLINTEQRLKRLYGTGLTVISTPGVGTEISFRIPA